VIAPEEHVMPHATLDPLFELLHQMRKMIERLDDAEYASPAPGRSSGGIGGHVRHCLDHVSALLAATRTGLCAYDRRDRGTAIETSRTAAIDEIAELTRGLLHLDPSALDGEVLVETQLDTSGSMVITRSSVSREIAYLVSHTIHHNAIVGQMMNARGLAVPPRFGLAPATPAEKGDLVCAR
jgi:hypothetical protein